MLPLSKEPPRSPQRQPLFDSDGPAGPVSPSSSAPPGTWGRGGGGLPGRRGPSAPGGAWRAPRLRPSAALTSHAVAIVGVVWPQASRGLLCVRAARTKRRGVRSRAAAAALRRGRRQRSILGNKTGCGAAMGCTPAPGPGLLRGAGLGWASLGLSLTQRRGGLHPGSPRCSGAHAAALFRLRDVLDNASATDRRFCWAGRVEPPCGRRSSRLQGLCASDSTWPVPRICVV